MKNTKFTPEMEAQLKKLKEMSDKDIDTSDIPEIKDWSKAVVGKFYRGKKEDK